MDASVSAALISVLGALGGAYIGSQSNQHAERLAKVERRLERYRAEIRARQAQEKEMCIWLVELEEAESERAAKLKLRERTEARSGLRPRVAPNEVAD